MTLRRIDPVEDPRWSLFLERDPRATVFHTPAWLEVLRRTYGYEPRALTTASPGHDLSNGLVFCGVRSWLTGCRIVSLPFSDHCEPLVENRQELEYLLCGLKTDLNAKKWKYVEIRPIKCFTEPIGGMVESERFWLHRLDLHPSLEELYHSLHKDCIQRKIRRAEREALTYEAGRSEALLGQFYRLLVLTRRRQHLPPQPWAWFLNLTACMGDNLKIRVVSKNAHPVASILTLRHKGTLVYKYGCSDDRLNSLGGMQMLIWKAIQEAKYEGLVSFDLGRSEWHNDGLVQFKDRWGAAKFPLTYWRYPSSLHTADDVGKTIAKHIFAHLPDSILPTAGRFLYRHAG